MSAIPPSQVPIDPRAVIILFDGDCPLCQTTARWLKRIDWWKRLRFQNARDVEHLPQIPVPLDPQRLLEEMHVIAPDRRSVTAGFAGFRTLCRYVPLLWAVLPLMYFPGIPQLGQRIYLWVAKNRLNLLPCHDGVCRLPSKPKSMPPSASARSA